MAILDTIDATELAKNNYTDYSKYVAQGRSYPSLYDGAKSSYRRAIYGMYLNKTSKKVKVAELAAHALPCLELSFSWVTGATNSN